MRCGWSVIGGARYSVSYKSNLTTASAVTGAIASAFSSAKEGDVSVIYMLSHGTVDNGEYRWHLYGSGSTLQYVSGSQIVSAKLEEDGTVVPLEK